MIKSEENEFIGWYGGDYEDAGFFGSKVDAERGMYSDDKLHELLKEFQGKKIKITVEILED